MKEMYVTKEELDYYSNPISINSVNEATIPYKPKMSFEEAVKACNGITIDEFSKMWEESINRLMPNP